MQIVCKSYVTVEESSPGGHGHGLAEEETGWLSFGATKIILFALVRVVLGKKQKKHVDKQL